MYGRPSTLSSAVNSKNNEGGGTNKQTQRRTALSLPPWMTIHHLPERGIVFNPALSFSSRNVNDGSKMVEVGGDNDAVTHATTTANNFASHRPSRRQRTRGRGIAGVGDETTTLTSASNYKTKKDIALDSIYPPTLQEVHGHTRYLTECAMRIIISEVENCVKYSLKYSWNDLGVSKDDITARSNNEVKYNINAKRKMGLKEDDKHHLSTLAHEIHYFFDMFQPTTDEVEVHQVDDQQQHLDDLHEDHHTNNILCDVLRPERYNPTLLPVMVVKCHPNVLDRAEITKGLICDLSRREIQRKRSPCVCVIRSASELVRKGRVMAELLSQCIKNDHVHGESFAMELQRQRKRRKSHRYGGVNNGVLVRSIWSWTQSLVDWAGYTETFDSIIVILEDPEEIPSPILDLFFNSLSSLRSGKEDDDGVPISVVVMDASPGGLGDRLSKLCRPAFRGGTEGGAVVREIGVPPPQMQWDLFVNRLFSTDNIPTFLWTKRRVLIDIQEVLRDYDNSIVSVGRLLTLRLRRYFAVPGAFISMLHCKKFTIPNEARIKWLFGDECGRKIIFSHVSDPDMASINDQKDGNIIDMFGKVQSLYVCHQICQKMNSILDMSPIGEIMTFSERHISWHLRDLLRLLGNVRRRVVSWSDTSTKLTTSLQQELNKFVILAGKFVFNDESDIVLARAIVEHVMTWAKKNMAMQIKVDDVPMAQPRRDVAIALFSSAPQSLEQCPLAHARRIAFGVFQSRVMTLADWYEKYFDAIASSEDQGNDSCSNEAAFFFAVYELVHMGFVHKLSTGKRKEEAFEKISIIWGNGK